MKRGLKRAGNFLARLAVKLKLLPDYVVLQMDGGICSQMHFLAVGSMLEDMGRKVAYDLSWFDRVGKDVDGRFCRNFDLEKLFPKVKLHRIGNGFVKWVYYHLLWKHNDYFAENPLEWLHLRGPVYYDGYFFEPDNLYTEKFKEIFLNPRPALSPADLATLEHIEALNTHADTCAVHVRRGDLAKAMAAYGEPASAEYFLKAMERVKRESENVHFFFFSDEPEWVENNLFPIVEPESFTLCLHNGSEGGYLDLYLMSQCHHIVTSQGSMGKYAALMRTDGRQNGLVTLRPDHQDLAWRNRLSNTEVISPE